uniref:Thioredoxin domain-containing protein n=1 Tax=Mantoniella antarctica TaxID=81844 RepID=A0A7S0T4B1_9CHLO
MNTKPLISHSKPYTLKSQNSEQYTKASLRRAHALDALGRADEALDAFAMLRALLPGDQSIADAVNTCRAAGAGGAGGNTVKEKAGPIHISSGEHYRAVVARAKLCLVDFTASWCGPCKQIAPVFERLALQHPAVHFLKVDVDEVQEVAAAENVRSMPTFKLYRYGVKVEEFSGADPNKLGQLIDQYWPTIA